MSTQNNSVFKSDPSTPIHSGARSFLLPGGQVGILLVHGFGGSIGDFRTLAFELQQQGFTVGGLCLPGHGQTPEVLATFHQADWREAVFSAAREMKKSSRSLVLVGASFGGALVIDYAVHAPSSIAGVLVINTAMQYRGGGPLQAMLLKLLRLRSPFYKKSSLSDEDRNIMREIGSLDRWPINGILETQQFNETFLRPALPRLQVPLRVMTTRHDPYVTPESAQQMLTLAGSINKKLEIIDIASHRPIRHPEGRNRIITVIQSLAGLETNPKR